jgi:DNA polymerase III epsilon subunit family exonuclease
MNCLICGKVNEALLCKRCRTAQNIELVLDQLLLYKNCQADNEVLKEYVLSFESGSEMADEVLSICSENSKFKIDFTYYIASAYKVKGKNFRQQFIECALRYMNNPTKNKNKTIELLRDLARAYAAEYEFYKALEICDLLLGSDYEYLGANLLKAENLLKIRRMEDALEILQVQYGKLKEREKSNEFINEEEKLKNEKYIEHYKNAILDYKEKKSKGYTYVPTTAIGKSKLKALLEREGRCFENQTIKEQIEASFNSFVCFDFETTGFGNYDKITEIGAVKVVNGRIVEYFSELVNPKRKIPEPVIEITGITNEMVKDKETIYEVLPRFLKFAGDSILVAHNAKFDCRFLLIEAEKLGCKIKNPVLDTMALAKRKLPRMTSYRLTALTDHFGIDQKDAHRAYCDAEATAKLYFKLRSL